MKSLLRCFFAGLFAWLAAAPLWSAQPNVIFFLADDLGYGDLGCYGQKLIQTPHLDRLAQEGMRFTQFYAGSPVCAPSRCVLMTGRHAGHCTVRGNAPENRIEIQALKAGEKTLPGALQQAGYATALFGKWGLGEVGSDGHPQRQGFNEFFGFLNQHHAHNYFPTFLVRGTQRVSLRNPPAQENPQRGEGWAREKNQYAPDLIFEEALQWMEQNREKPFFLYLATTLPHANNEATRGTGDGQEVPDYGIYADKPWPKPDKGQAAMISRLDRDAGRLMARLKEMGLDNRTVIFFSSDNGPHKEGNNNPELFDANGPLRGMKRDLYEGGIRVPFLARWPGRIKAGTVSDHPGYFGDVFTTVCELAGVSAPPGLDSVSFAPTLLGRGSAQKQAEYLYWEFYEQGGRQAVRFGKWKAVRQPIFTGKIELYDLSADLGEVNDLAAMQPDLVSQAGRFMGQAHLPNPNWQVRGK